MTSTNLTTMPLLAVVFLLLLAVISNTAHLTHVHAWRGLVQVGGAAAADAERQPPPTRGHASVLYDDKLVVFGGRSMQLKATPVYVHPLYAPQDCNRLSYCSGALQGACRNTTDEFGNVLDEQFCECGTYRWWIMFLCFLCCCYVDSCQCNALDG
jgi:hypothetical protein